jgi:hypothetical protein
MELNSREVIKENKTTKSSKTTLRGMCAECSRIEVVRNTEEKSVMIK